LWFILVSWVDGKKNGLGIPKLKEGETVLRLELHIKFWAIKCRR